MEFSGERAVGGAAQCWNLPLGCKWRLMQQDEVCELRGVFRAAAGPCGVPGCRVTGLGRGSMVCQAEVWLWFRDSEPHRRLELLCGLLNMCLPMELRFISTCVEDLGKRDFHDLREAESKANNSQEIERLSNLLDERTRSNLIVYIALLGARNHPCSSLLYQVLAQAAPRDATLADVNHIKELLLIYTMVLHHPAFTFEQKRVIAELHGQASRLEGQLDQRRDLLDARLMDSFPGCPAAAEVGQGAGRGGAAALGERLLTPGLCQWPRRPSGPDE